MKLLCILVFLFISFCCRAQTDSASRYKMRIWKNTSLHGVYQNGYVFPTNEFLKGKNGHAKKITSFQTYSLKLSTQTIGENLWEQLYKYPSWGFGVYAADFHNRSEIGVPIAVYGFFNAPFKRWNRVTFNYEVGFGATFNWKSYNPITNQYNVAIGAGESFLIDAGLNLEYRFTDRLVLVSGFSLTHFSNGALKKPNYGINTIAPKVALKYNFYDPLIYRMQAVPKYVPENEWLISVFGGAKNVIFDSVKVDIKEKYEGVFFPVYGISAAYNRQISYMSKIGFGMTVSYDGSINAQLDIETGKLEHTDGPLSDKMQVSIYPSYELVVNRMSLILQPALYIYRRQIWKQCPDFHQRIGLKYHFTDNLFFGLTLRYYQFHVSDYIEWNVGYRMEGR